MYLSSWSTGSDNIYIYKLICYVIRCHNIVFEERYIVVKNAIECDVFLQMNDIFVEINGPGIISGFCCELCTSYQCSVIVAVLCMSTLFSTMNWVNYGPRISTNMRYKHILMSSKNKFSMRLNFGPVFSEAVRRWHWKWLLQTVNRVKCYTICP